VILTKGVLAGPGEEILVDLTGGVLVDLTEETEEETGLLKGMRCIRQYATNAAETVKFLSNQPRENLFTAMTVLKIKAGKLVQDLNLKDNPMKTLTKSTRNLTGF